MLEILDVKGHTMHTVHTVELLYFEKARRKKNYYTIYLKKNIKIVAVSQTVKNTFDWLLAFVNSYWITQQHGHSVQCNRPTCMCHVGFVILQCYAICSSKLFLFFIIIVSVAAVVAFLAFEFLK